MAGTRDKQTARFGLISVLLLILCAPFAAADGMIHIYDPDMERWSLQNEERQLGAINYEDGMQQMILTVDAGNLSGEKAVWIFPIPAQPENIRMDVVKEFPRLVGPDIVKGFHNEVWASLGVSAMSQFSIFAPLVLIFTGYLGVMDPGALLGYLEGDITIHEQLSKGGLTLELVTAKSGTVLYEYLQSRGLELPKSSVQILENYVGKEFSFVITRISDVGLYKRSISQAEEEARYYHDIIPTMGVHVTFPTDRMYFPLMPTSVYGDKKIPILIYVIGHISPILYPSISGDTKVNYFKEYAYTVSDQLSSFFNGAEEFENLPYTKIKIEVPSSHFTEDLWINDRVPARVSAISFLNRIRGLIMLLFFTLSSCLASMLSGLIVFRKENPSKRKFALFGLWNYLSILGFIIATLLLNVRK